MEHHRRLRRLSLLMIVPVFAATAVAALWMTTVVDRSRADVSELARQSAQYDTLLRGSSIASTRASYLMGLDAFGEHPPPELELYASTGRATRESMGYGRLVGFLTAATGDAPDVLRQLERLGVEPSASVRAALAPIPQGTLRSLAKGDGASLDGRPFAAAVNWLSERSAHAKGAGEAARMRLARLDREPPPWRDPAFVGVALAVAMLTAMALIALRRRVLGVVVDVEREGAGLAQRNAQLTSLLEVMRKVASSLDADDVTATAAEQAVLVAGGEFAVVVRPVGQRLEPVARHGEILPVAVARDAGVVGHVVDSGVSARVVVGDDPLLPNERGPLSLIGAPLVAGGKVLGAVLVGRRSQQLREPEDEMALRLLGMCVAAALEAARVHGGASELALTDSLTGLGNRRRLEQTLARVLAESGGDEPVAVTMIDIDHFKSYNDTFGHPAGDEALRRVATLVAAAVRSEDAVFRYGGEELVVVLPGASLPDALVVAERARAAVALHGALAEAGREITISAGVAAAAGGSAAELIAAADAALYHAKHSGRNRVVAAERPQVQ